MNDIGTLLKRTWELIENKSSNDLVEIQSQTGIGYFWLLAFRKRKNKNPSVNKVQRLFEHLSGRKLDISIPKTSKTKSLEELWK